MKTCEKSLRFDNARELEDVLGRREEYVPALEEAFGVRAVVRDLEVRLAGAADAVASAWGYLDGLVRARNAGMWLHRSLVDQTRRLWVEGREKELACAWTWGRAARRCFRGRWARRGCWRRSRGMS